MVPKLCPKARTPLTVTLPNLISVPAGYRGRPYTIRRLLASGDTNTKLAKSNTPNAVYRTFGLSLAPADSSGHQLCASSSPGCRAACLFRQGRGGWAITQAARIAKAVALMQDRTWFVKTLQR